MSLDSKNILAEDWAVWAAQNLMRGVSIDRIVSILVENGLNEGHAKEGVASVVSNAIESNARLSRILRKQQAIMTIQGQLAKLAPTVERRSGLSKDEFLNRYYIPNRPVIITDVVTQWPAYEKWNLPFLRDNFGNEAIQVMLNRASDPEYELNMEKHKVDMNLSEFVDMVEEGGETNDYYMVANNFVFQQSGMRNLLTDIQPFPDYLSEEGVEEGVHMWFGPAGTVTPLHHDWVNILLSQVLGRKRVRLIPASQIHLVYNYRGVYSRVDSDIPDHGAFPLFQEAHMLEFTLGVGEMLFIPVGWWHDVKALDVSISVTLSNFVFPNRYQRVEI